MSASQYRSAMAKGLVSRKRQSTKSTKQVAQQVAQLLGGESKFFDEDVDQAVGDLSAGVILNGGTAGTLNAIPQGVTSTTRVGRKATIKAIGWRGTVSMEPVASTQTPVQGVVRLMLVLDRQANGATATVTGNPSGLLASANYQSFNNLANKDRFRVLMDRTFDFETPSGAGDGTVANDWGGKLCSFTFFKNVDIPLEFNSTTGALTEINSNNLFGVMIASSASSVFSLDSKMRLRFSDF